MTFLREDAVVILGSSRSDGNTRTAVSHVLGDKVVELVDLSEMDIGAYDYRHANQSDSFLPLIERLLSKPFWILATPVYWYTMSAQMKLFVDRLSDLITIRKELGRQLRGKSLAIIASGTEKDLPEGFEAPFRLTCHYLGIRYLGASYLQFGEDDQPVAAGAMDAAAVSAHWLS